MENPRPEKVALVDEVRERFSGAGAALLTEYRGLNVSDMATLRRSLREAGGDYKIYKNTLVRFAVRDLGLPIEDLLLGPTAIAFVDGDAVGVAKALRDFARGNPNLVVKGGLLGDKILSADEARALADIPPRDVLLARLAGGLAAPLQQFAGLLQALPRNLAYGLKALIDERGGVPEGAADTAADESAEPANMAAVASDEPVTDPTDAVAAPAPEAPETTETPETPQASDTPAPEPETRPDENPKPPPGEQEPAEGGDDTESE
jgi:large subunit ribosomal protein L10